MMQPLLQVADLRTYFHTDEGTAKAVDGVAFALAEQETLGIVGESGCGKSVTALSILRLIPDPPGRVESGSVGFQGRDLLELSEKEMRRIRGNEIAMIFQEPMTSLNPVYTVGEQISEVLRLHRGMTRSEAPLSGGSGSASAAADSEAAPPTACEAAGEPATEAQRIEAAGAADMLVSLREISKHLGRLDAVFEDKIRFDPEGNGTRVTYTARLELKSVLAVGDPFLRLMFKRIGDDATRDIASAVAAGAPTASAA